MWDLFTERARHVIYGTEKEAASMRQSSITPEHLLLALTREPGSMAERLLTGMGVTLEEIRGAIEHEAERGNAGQTAPGPGTRFTMSPHGKRVLDKAFEQHKSLGDSYLGTEHLLLGIIADREGLAARVLTDRGVDLEYARRTEELLRKSADRL
ncbi:MAG: Clp protease N-terminal domain-containing protein [Armatimonadota bacterium]